MPRTGIMPRRKRVSALDKDPYWYKNSVIYELHVRAFHDSNGDGIGDFRGLTEKLDYLHDLGVTAIWLLPFYPSPLKDDGYDIADYYSVHPDYGTLSDFRVFLREAHAHGLRVITELVINHTSDQHPWFQRARRAKAGSRARDFYVWSDTAEEYSDARIIFKDFEPSNWSWDPAAQAYFWHRFYSHQPDLNFDNPAVQREIFKVLDFWLGMGVDGLRLDAVPYLFEREGTNCENLEETHEFLKKLRRHVDEKHTGRMLLAEANQWPEDAVAYFGSGEGDECHMAFHFPLMPRLFMALRMEDRVPIVDILDDTPMIPEKCQWALFLRNHDELTLEMVTDEERDYMYRVYAHDRRARINLGIRRRLVPLLGNDRKRIELLNAILLSLPGTPVIYYGDEIGMGENIFLGDRNGVRTPMQWSADRNAGFSRANPQSLYLPVIVDPEYHYETNNVDTQQRNTHSLLWWMKRLIALRKRHKALGSGTVEFLHPQNRKILAFLREYDGESILVVANLSRFVQPVELDLSEHAQKVPIELFGHTRLPAIGEDPYFLTLSPHTFYWFALEPRFEQEQDVAKSEGGMAGLPTVSVPGGWETVLEKPAPRARLERILQKFLPDRRWFGGKSREIKGVDFIESIPVGSSEEKVLVTMLEVDYVASDSESYLLPLAFAKGEQAETLLQERPQLCIANLKFTGDEPQGILYDAVGNREFMLRLLNTIAGKRQLRGRKGSLACSASTVLRKVIGKPPVEIEPKLGSAEQSNTGVIFEDRVILKLFRRLEDGINPDLEVGRFLSSKRFANIPRTLGSIEYRTKQTSPTTVGILSAFVPESKDAWTHALEVLERYYDRVQSLPEEDRQPPEPAANLAQLAASEVPAANLDMVGVFVESAFLLGQRTAELHRTLASDKENRDFAPEPFSPHYQRSLFQALRKLAAANFQLLRENLRSVPSGTTALARRVADLEGDCIRSFRRLLDRRIRAVRTRCHGDYHLGQVLYTGKDFFIIDFEGEPARSIGERRLKRSPLRDVAGMLRSFHYAAWFALDSRMKRGALHPESLPEMEPWVRFWYSWVSAVYLQSYLEHAGTAAFLPADKENLWLLLDTFLLEKAIYEVGYELNNRPAWVRIPLQGILDTLQAE